MRWSHRIDSRRRRGNISYNFADVRSSSFTRFQRYFSSSVGTKLLIGITGLLLFA